MRMYYLYNYSLGVIVPQMLLKFFYWLLIEIPFCKLLLQLNCKWMSMWNLKLVPIIFFYFTTGKHLKNYETCFFFYRKSFFRSIQVFVLPSFSLFSPVTHYWIYRGSWLKINPKVYLRHHESKLEFKIKLFKILRRKDGLILNFVSW